MSYELFETPKDSIALLVDLILDIFNDTGMDEEDQEIICSIVEQHAKKMKVKEQKALLNLILVWSTDLMNNMKYWKSTMEINTCCADSECGAYQDANQFLRSYGIEPSIKQEEDHVCLKFNFPKGKQEKRKFINELEKRLNQD